MVGMRLESSEIWGPFVGFPSTSFLNTSIFKPVEGSSTFLRNVVTCLQNYRSVTSEKAVICSVASTNVSFNLLKLPLPNFVATLIPQASITVPGIGICRHVPIHISDYNSAWRLQHEDLPQNVINIWASSRSQLQPATHITTPPPLFSRYIWRFVNWYIFRCFRDWLSRWIYVC